MAKKKQRTDHDTFLPFLKAGDAIFTYKDNWLNRRILWFSKYKHTLTKKKFKIAHVALYLGLVEDIPKIAEADWKGIVIRPFKVYDKKHFTLHVARPKERELNDMDRVYLKTFAVGMKKISYAYRQILAHAVKKFFRMNKVGDWDEDSMICSEFYVEALKLIKIELGKKDPADYNPLEIYMHERMKKITC